VAGPAATLAVMEPEGARPSRRTGRPVTFRPRFMVTILYVAAFTMLFGLALALPDLVRGAMELPPGPRELSEEELAEAREIAREALGGGRVLVALAAAVVTVGLGAYARVLPGLR
jgi:hypothetical protein